MNLVRVACSLPSVPENKISIIKVIRSLLRENMRRNMKNEGTLERSCKERLAPMCRTLPSSAKLGELRLILNIYGFILHLNRHKMCRTRVFIVTRGS